MEKRVWVYVAADLILGTIPLILLTILLPDLTLAIIGLLFGGMLVVVFSFTARFHSDLDQVNGSPSMSDIAHRLRMIGLEAEETQKSVIVHFDRWTAIDLRFQEHGNESRLIYRLDATSSSMAILVFIFLSTIFGVLAIPLCIYLLIEAERYARRFIIPNLCGELSSTQSPPEGIKGLLIDSLSTYRRLAEEAFRAENSTYEDIILAATIAIGLIGGLVLFAVLSQLPIFESSYRLAASALSAFTISIATCVISILFVKRRVKPRIDFLLQWITRLDKALTRELTDQKSEEDESSIELLFSAYDEVPIWLNSRRKSIINRYPTTSILMGLMTIWGVSLIFSGALSLIGSEWFLSSLIISIGAILVVGAYLLQRKVTVLERTEGTRLAQDLQRRREALRRMIGLHLEENGNV
jgi:hypothetical protein